MHSTFELPDFPEFEEPLFEQLEDLSLIIARGRSDGYDMPFEEGSMNPIDYMRLVLPCKYY